MDSVGRLDFVLPLEQSFSQEGDEQAIKRAALAVFNAELGQAMQDLADYGCPHIGSRTVIERFAKQDGLVVLRRSDTTDKLMQIIYANWASLASERGTGFLEFVLRMLWGDQWAIYRLWHSISQIERYPSVISRQPLPDYFLTSRILLLIGQNVAIDEIREIVPMVRKLVPAHIVLSVQAQALNGDASLTVGVASRGKVVMFWDLT